LSLPEGRDSGVSVGSAGSARELALSRDAALPPIRAGLCAHCRRMKTNWLTYDPNRVVCKWLDCFDA